MYSSGSNQTAMGYAMKLSFKLSSHAKVLTEAGSEDFKKSMLRFSDIDLQTPGAIVFPACENDVQLTVQTALQYNIPFVAKAGGHSNWSTIGASGWIIDLVLLDGIELDTNNHTATIQAGVLTKPFNTVLSSAGFCACTAGAATVGVIPMMLGGGTSWLTGRYGLAVDNFISARVITATGELLDVSDSTNSDLFWALKGAGQFFGLVTELTMRIFPMKDQILTWTSIFGPHQINEVAEALEIVVNSGSVDNAGMAAIVAPPGQSKPIIVISMMHFCLESEAEMAMKPILAAKPLQQVKKLINFAQITDGADALNTQGGLKSQISCGMQTFDGKKFAKSLEIYNALVSKYPSAAGSCFLFPWFPKLGMAKSTDESSPFSHRDVLIWSMMFVTAPDQQSADAAVRCAEGFVAMCQDDQREDEKASFPNHTRTQSLEQRYRGADRLERLKGLKKLWDPNGIFTTQLL